MGFPKGNYKMLLFGRRSANLFVQAKYARETTRSLAPGLLVLNYIRKISNEFYS